MITNEGFLELLKTRRSCRKFKPGPDIPDETIMQILGTARWAMSGSNIQPWEFVVIKNRATIKKIAEICLEEKKDAFAVEQALKDKYRQPLFDHLPTDNGWENAMLLILVCGDRRPLQASVMITNIIPSDGGPGSLYLKDMANVAQILQLSITALGLASRWVSVSRSYEEALKRLLDIPDLLDIHNIVPVGYWAYTPAPVKRQDLKDTVHFEKFDRNKFRSMDEIMQSIVDLRAEMRPAYHKTE